MPTTNGLPTISETLAVGHDLFVTCRYCRHTRQLDLAALTRSGYGDRSPYDLRWRCEICGGRHVWFTVSAERVLS